MQLAGKMPPPLNPEYHKILLCLDMQQRINMKILQRALLSMCFIIKNFSNEQKVTTISNENIIFSKRMYSEIHLPDHPMKKIHFQKKSGMSQK